MKLFIGGGVGQIERAKERIILVWVIYKDYIHVLDTKKIMNHHCPFNDFSTKM
jgi:hypothetical protein